jgi:pSer/pThr/pTyr-binding forkhead associated (FHA) protein
MSNDRVVVVEPNGVKRTIPLSRPMMTIGRGDNCEIRITYNLISRNHAQITLEPDGYYVADLGTTNGTYLNNTRLEPNVPTRWLPNRSLRVGEVVLQLEQDMSRVSQDNQGTVFAADLSAIEGYGTKQNPSRKGLYISLAVLSLVILVIVLGYIFLPIG